MTYVGVDIAKHTHYASITGRNNAVLTAPFAFDNNIEGFTKLLNALKKFRKNDIIIGLEATGTYGENLVEFLSDKDYKIAVINPLETSETRRKRTRNAKTDRIDSLVICKYLSSNEYRLMQPKELQMLKLRGLCRFLQTLKKSNQRLKIQLVQYLDVVFPEFHTLFSKPHLKSTYAVLSEFPTAVAIANANITKLTNLMQHASHGKIKRNRAEQLKALAKRSVGSKTVDNSFQIKHTITQIRLIETQLKEVKKQITKTFNSLDSVIKTVPGIGAIEGAMILSEIGDIKRFSNPNQLIAFAGLDPAVKQSGNFKATTTKMSKRGSPTLRYALVYAAWNVSLNNATFGEFYDKKIAERRGHYSALGHVAGKLTRVIFKMLKDNVEFDLP